MLQITDTEMPEGDESTGDRWILLIAMFKLVKGLLLVAAGIGALKLLHQDVGEIVQRWIDVLRVDPDSRFIHSLLVRILSVNDHTLKEISAGTFAYAAVFLTEGTGLLLRKRWAQYFTIIVTTSFLPLELYELTRYVTVAKFGVILVNIAIVVYLFVIFDGTNMPQRDDINDQMREIFTFVRICRMRGSLGKADLHNAHCYSRDDINDRTIGDEEWTPFGYLAPNRFETALRTGMDDKNDRREAMTSASDSAVLSRSKAARSKSRPVRSSVSSGPTARARARSLI